MSEDKYCHKHKNTSFLPAKIDIRPSYFVVPEHYFDYIECPTCRKLAIRETEVTGVAPIYISFPSLLSEEAERVLKSIGIKIKSKHLSREQRGKLVEKFQGLKNPTVKDAERIAKECGIDTELVREIRAKAEGTSPKVSLRIKRNEPCSCGSGKKYKKCCGLNLI